jgi:hypothetical protein
MKQFQRRAVVSVATGPYYPRGQARLISALNGTRVLAWTNCLPPGSPAHTENPFAFKAWALRAAWCEGATTLLWCDACMYPVRGLESLWERIERDGYWISANGYRNAEWTVPEAYPLLGVTREENEHIPHVVATAFGLDLTKEIGRAIFNGYLRYAENGAFVGPVRIREGSRDSRGDMQVTGHRHDQTALSILAHRAGCVLTNPPDIFNYGKVGGVFDERTILIADGSYV